MPEETRRRMGQREGREGLALKVGLSSRFPDVSSGQQRVGVFGVFSSVFWGCKGRLPPDICSSNYFVQKRNAGLCSGSQWRARHPYMNNLSTSLSLASAFP